MALTKEQMSEAIDTILKSPETQQQLREHLARADADAKKQADDTAAVNAPQNRASWIKMPTT